MPTANPIDSLVAAKKAAIRELEDLLEQYQQDLLLPEGAGNFWGYGGPWATRYGYLSSSPGSAKDKLRRDVVPQTLRELNADRLDLADLQEQARQLDEAAGKAIKNGTDPATAYQDQLAKMQAKATLLTVLKWAAIIGAAILVLMGARRLFQRIAKR